MEKVIYPTELVAELMGFASLGFICDRLMDRSFSCVVFQFSVNSCGCLAKLWTPTLLVCWRLKG